MTGPIPRLTPYEVLQVLDQMRLEAEEAERMVVWRHSTCGGFSRGIWEPDAACRWCSYEVTYREHVDQYLLVPVKEPAAPGKPRCSYCAGFGVVPDSPTRWNNGEPEAVPCPQCSPPQPAG